MNGFRSLGCDVVLPDEAPRNEVQALFEARDRRFSRLYDSSELNRVNVSPRGLTVVSEEFASMLSLALDAARATGGLVTPAAGGALTAAGSDRDFPRLPLDGVAVEPARVPSFHSIVLRGTALRRSEPVRLDLDGVVKARTVDDALQLLGRGWVSAGGAVATTVPLVVELPGGDTIALERGGLATTSLAEPSSSWRHVTVVAQSCYVADVAARAALLLGAEGPSWLDRRQLPGRFVDRDGYLTVTKRWLEAPQATLAA